MARLNLAAMKWRERIGRWKQSKLTVTEFCRQEQVSQPSFFQWRKRLRDERTKVDEAPRFVELRPAAWSTMPGVQITLPSGAVVTVPGSISTELMTAVVRAAMIDPREDRPC
jgi:hypothetical protein